MVDWDCAQVIMMCLYMRRRSMAVGAPVTLWMIGRKLAGTVSFVS